MECAPMVASSDNVALVGSIRGPAANTTTLGESTAGSVANRPREDQAGSSKNTVEAAPAVMSVARSNMARTDIVRSPPGCTRDDRWSRSSDAINQSVLRDSIVLTIGPLWLFGACASAELQGWFAISEM